MSRWDDLWRENQMLRDAAGAAPQADEGLRAVRAAIEAMPPYWHPVHQTGQWRRDVLAVIDNLAAAPVPAGLDVERLISKAKRWKERGMLTEDQYGAICAVVFVETADDLTPEQRAAAVAQGRRILDEHPEIEARALSQLPEDAQ